MAKKHQQNKYDLRHWNNLKKYESQLDAIYREAIREAIAISGSIASIDTDKIFSFDDYPSTRKRMESLIEDMKSQVEAVVLNGIDAEWTLANNKNSELANWVFGDAVGKLTQAQYRRYYSTNDSARRAFAARRVDGLNLSQRVWNLAGQFKSELELGLDVGIRSGRSADDLSRDIRQYLRRPDMLFRRVKDEHGNLQLSRRAAAYHPGRGVYRSSYKNARRLAATETNIAYRTADYLRWQQMDFVVGIEIRTSPTNHPVTDICDELKGKYPKDFKFTGWHPHCRCHAITILKTQEEVDADTQRILNGEQPTDPSSSVNHVKDVPRQFKDWLEDNKERAKRSFSVPYFLKDNQQYLPNGYFDLFAMKMPYDSYSAYEAAMKFNRANNAFSKEQLANIRELNEVMPVVQGKIMNFTEADGTRPNPLYDRSTKDYSWNCATCVATFLLRRWGFDISAGKFVSGKGKVHELYLNPLGAWKRKDGLFIKHADDEVLKHKEWALERKSSQSKSLRSFIQNNTDDGGIYMVRLGWKKGGGHLTIVERDKAGNMIYYDPQTGKKNWLSKWEPAVDLTQTWMMRIDDKLIDTSFSSAFLKAQ